MLLPETLFPVFFRAESSFIISAGEAQAVFSFETTAAVSDTRGKRFTDVAADSYCTEAVRWVVSEGITSGTGAATFSPSADCTGAQIVTFLYRQLGK